MSLQYPIMVLDGPDCAGKSTLAEELVKLTGGHHLHLTYRWPTKMHLYHQAALNFCVDMAKKKPVILDRWWMSEIAYANVFRNGSVMQDYVPGFREMFEATGGTYVLCLPYRMAYEEHYLHCHDKRLEKKHAMKGRDEREAEKKVAARSAVRVWDEYRIISQGMTDEENITHYNMFEFLGLQSLAAEIIYQRACDNFYGRAR